MRKKFILFLLIFLSIQGIFAVEITMNSEYNRGETLIAKISGNFLTSLGRENIFFYKGHTKIPLEFDITKIDYDYYLYAVLSDKAEGNYSLSIENIKYKVGPDIEEENIVKNFSISNKAAEFFLDKGFIVSLGEFSLTLENLNDTSLIINISTEELDPEIYVYSEEETFYSLSLRSGESKKIFFFPEEGENKIQNITIFSENTNYTIPVYITKSESSPGIIDSSLLGFLEEKITLSAPTNSIYKKNISFTNLNDSDLNEIKISVSEELSYFTVLSQTEIDSLKKDSTSYVELSFFSEEEISKEGYIYFNVSDESISIPVSISFFKEASSVETSSFESCSELGGIICDTKTKNCSVNALPSKEGWCCTGTCEDKKQNNSGRIIGIVLILLVLGFIVWFYFKKYKKSKKPVDLLKIAKSKN